MICPTCRTVTADALDVCPVCEQPYTAAPSPAAPRGQAGRIVEGSFVEESTSEMPAFTAVEHAGATDTDESTTVLVTTARTSLLPAVTLPSPGGALAPMLHALPRLPALAWQQPAVRAAVRTGASAVAVSVATRVATRWLARRLGNQAVQQGAQTLLPMLGDALGQGLKESRAPRSLLPRRGRGGNVTVETFIYVRRTISTE